MRSKIALKILSETPPEVREKVKVYADEVVRRHNEVEATVLTDEEIKRAIWSAKVQKWNQESNREYFENLEKKKPSEHDGRL